MGNFDGFVTSLIPCMLTSTMLLILLLSRVGGRITPSRAGQKDSIWEPQPSQNVVCGIAALRFSEFDSQQSKQFHPRK